MVIELFGEGSDSSSLPGASLNLYLILFLFDSEELRHRLLLVSGTLGVEHESHSAVPKAGLFTRSIDRSCGLRGSELLGEFVTRTGERSRPISGRCFFGITDAVGSLDTVGEGFPFGVLRMAWVSVARRFLI